MYDQTCKFADLNRLAHVQTALSSPEIAVIQSIEPDDPLGFGEMPAEFSDIVVATMRLKRMFDADSARVLAAVSGMREVDWRILYVLHVGGLLPQKEVMRVIEMERAQASRALQRLKETGKVRSIRDAEDRRTWKFEQTDEGRAGTVVFSAAFHDVFALIHAAFDEGR